MSFSYYEFFAGGGMARMGLGEHWQCPFANDFCPKNAASYRRNFPDGNELLVDDAWHSRTKTRCLLSQMSPSNAFKVEQAMKLAGTGRKLVIGMGYRRTRLEQGKKVQRFEVRFDGIAGCLRTPGGGSSRQFILFAEPNRVRTRLISAREAIQRTKYIA